MKYRDLREFVTGLERQGELTRISEPVSTYLDMTAVSDRVLRAGGPALWFDHPIGRVEGSTWDPPSSTRCVVRVELTAGEAMRVHTCGADIARVSGGGPAACAAASSRSG